jgi:hypothetical protein
MRSLDFERIYNEFVSYYADGKEAEKQYYDWVKTLQLDESKPYERCRESYYWKKEDIQFIKEDGENKYYEVEIGFPTRSMNGNIYKTRDFIAASLTLAGKSPSLNHKDEFWFSRKNPNNRWGNIEIVEGKFHENRSKALMKVPKNMVCPVCNGGLMTELIDKKQIYNVSLEGDCRGGQCETGECDGFVYLDPPFTLLTTDVLPGIPMTRIKPIEAFLPFSRESNNKEGKRMKLKPTIKEDMPTTPDPKTVKTDTRTTDGPIEPIATSVDADTKIDTPINSSGNATVLTGSSPADGVMKQHEQKVDEPFAGYTDFADCVAKNSDKEDPQAYCGSIKAKVEPKESTPPEYAGKPYTTNISTPPIYQGIAPMSGPSRTTPPEFATTDADKLPLEDDTELVMGPSPVTHGIWTGKSPVESLPTLEERRARVHAELQAKSSEEKAVMWEQKHNEVYTKLMEVNGQYTGLSSAFNKLNEHMRTTEDTLNRQLRSTEEKLNQQLHNAEVKKEEATRKYNEQCGLVTDLKHTLDDTKQSLDDTTRKYNESMTINLELSRKLTKANEEYLDLAKGKEDVEEQFKKAKTNAKKTLRLRI